MRDDEKSTAGPESAHDAGAIAESLSDISDKDVALKLVGEQAHSYDPATEARVVRKCDWFFLPAMGLLWGFQFYDKAILGSAVLFGMTEDLSLRVVDYSTKPPTADTSRLSWATSMFYFGELAGLYPLTFALQRFNIARLLGPFVIIWAAVCMATAGVTTWQGLYVQRFFLGFVESIIPVAAMTIISNYYTQKEQALRQPLWLWAPGVFVVLGGLVNYGFSQIEGRLHPWQYIYLLAGTLSLLFGLCCFAAPNSPVSAWFLTLDERFVAVERLRKGQTGVRCQKIKWTQVREAVLDVKIWLLALMMAATWTANGALTGFGPLIVSTLGWDSFHSILLQFPLQGSYSGSMLLCGYLSYRFPNIRIMLLSFFCLPVIAGCVMIWRSEWTHRAATPLVGFTFIGFFGAIVGQLFGLTMSNVAGATKKSCATSSVWVGFVVGNIVGPQLVRTQTVKRHYPELWLGLIICYCFILVCAGLLYTVLWRANKAKELVEYREEEKDKLAFQDLTDKENPYFRYVL